MTNRKRKPKYQRPDATAAAIARARMIGGRDDVELVPFDALEQLVTEGKVDADTAERARALQEPGASLFYVAARRSLLVIPRDG